MTACDNSVSLTSVIVSMIVLVRTTISAAATTTRFDHYPNTSGLDPGASLFVGSALLVAGADSTDVHVQRLNYLAS